MPINLKNDGAAPFVHVARYLAWIFLLLILGLSIFLCLMLGNRGREVVISKQYEFAALLGNNLNHQIYRRFTLPTLVGFGRIALRQPAQYERLDQLVRQVIHGMNVQDLRIYGDQGIIAYTINQENLGRGDLASPEVQKGITAQDTVFNIDSKISMLGAFFSLNLEPNTFILRTTCPLRIENPLSDTDDESPTMGVLEFTQDITADMIAVLQFQRSVIAIVLASCLLIFMIMVVFLNRAEKALAARVQEKERLLQQLHQHEKLAGMGRVIAGIAHEIRNPLGIISSSSQLLLKRANTDNSSAVILQAIYDESKRLSQTVTDFLDYAKPKQPRQEQVDICALLGQAIIFMKPEFDRHGVILEKTYFDENGHPAESPLYLVCGDKDLLYRAFYNILVNAVQAVGDQAQPTVRLLVGKAGSDVEIIVADNGPGFPQETVERCLDPFYTTKPLGSGLGLPIVSSIIASHQGSLELGNQTKDHKNDGSGWHDGAGGHEWTGGDDVATGTNGGAIIKVTLPLVRGTA
ncbi:MAG: two-component sensor histidine kinase [Deltaproteobacteria bacterium]|jgi:signal transduction histidine kinase|nr:two-component sensor histidine kinase [Deltaproteobacteria bacterium]